MLQAGENNSPWARNPQSAEFVTVEFVDMSAISMVRSQETRDLQQVHLLSELNSTHEPPPYRSCHTERIPKPENGETT